MKKNDRKRSGFTLIELITVLILLGILAAVITPKYFDLTSKAEEQAAKAAGAEGVARLNMGYANYILNNGVAPTLSQYQDVLGIGSDTTIDVGDYILDLDTGTGADGNEQVEFEVFKDDGTGTATGTALTTVNATWPESN